MTSRQKKFAAELLHQQCWCWGQDVRATENLLLAFGFVRHRAPFCPGATRYELARDELRIALWGFGMSVILADGTAGFFSRYRRGVWLLPRGFDVSGVHSAEPMLGAINRPTPGADYRLADRLARSMATWCERYERWVVARAGVDHRRATLADWEHPLAAAEEMPGAWRAVREIYRQWYAPRAAPEPIDAALARLMGHAPTMGRSPLAPIGAAR